MLVAELLRQHRIVLASVNGRCIVVSFNLVLIDVPRKPNKKTQKINKIK